ncbi:hypothetical protein RUND412_000255 [Rhizina undulata]
MLFNSFKAQILGAIFMAIGANCHSWIDNVRVVGGTSGTSGISNETLGYIRAYEGHIDATATYEIQDPELAVNVCRPSQQTATNTPNYPRLQAPPGAYIEGEYLENGHISKPTTPDSIVGDIWWYGSFNPNSAETLANVRNWTLDGTGGDKNGFLLANPTPFDDGVCIEANGSPIATKRLAEGLGGPCKSVFKIPETAKAGQTLTVYWVWNYSGELGPTVNLTEWYTSCMDIDIIASTPISAKFRGRRWF